VIAKTEPIRMIDRSLLGLNNKIKTPIETINNPDSKLIHSNIFFRLYLSIKVPEYSPQKRPINVIIPNIKEKEEFKSRESVKYQGILIIVIPEAIPDIMCDVNNRNKENLFFIYKCKFD
jgi:hypothetical protein